MTVTQDNLRCLNCKRKISRGSYCSNKCRQKAYRNRKRNGRSLQFVTSSIRSQTNADLIAAAASLYLTPGMMVADVTFGKGVFWRKVDTSLYDFRPSDLSTGTDFRSLPYEDGSMDVLILDPPYLSYKHGQTSSASKLHDAYRIDESFEEMGIEGMAQVMDLYRDGMIEADRVVKKAGKVWVKCQDALSGGRQHWNHITIYDIARDLGWYPKDLFVYTSTSTGPVRWGTQQHAKKTHSYLWVFEV